MNVIEVKNLTKTYGKARGISDVSFNVSKVKSLALSAERGWEIHDDSNVIIINSSNERECNDFRERHTKGRTGN